MKKDNKNEISELLTFQLLSLRTNDSLFSEDYFVYKQIYRKYGLGFIYRFAKQNGILPFVASKLIYIKEDFDFWEGIFDYYKERNKKILEKLDKIFYYFQSSKINAFLYENFAVLLLSKEHIACFSSNDVDLFAPIEYKQEIINILKIVGYEPKARRIDAPDVRLEFYDKNNTTEGIWINVMWQLLARKFIPVPKLDREQFLKEIIKIPNSNIFVPELTNLLFLCSLHASIHGYVRAPGIRLYVDVDRLVRGSSIDWDKFIKLAEKYEVRKRVLLSLLIAKNLLKTLIPVEVERSLYISPYIINIVYDFLSKRIAPVSYNIGLKKIELLILESLLCDSGLFSGVLKVLFYSKN